MKEKAIIKIEKRKIANSRASKQLRNEGYLPGSVFGKGLETFSVKLKESDLKKGIAKFGINYLYTLDLEGKETYTVMVKDIQQAPITNKLLSVDFHQISLAEEMKTDLDIKIIGRNDIEAKSLLVARQLDLIPVKGLPQDIPDYIEIDVTSLKLGDRITIADINFPKGITADIEAEQTVLLINDPTVNVEPEDEPEDDAAAETEDSQESSEDKEEA